jgi:hypothetical protein
MIAYLTLMILMWVFVIGSEILATKFPNTMYSKFWRKHIITTDDLDKHDNI